MSNTQYAVCHLQRGSGNDSGMSCHIERKDAKGKIYVPVNAEILTGHISTVSWSDFPMACPIAPRRYSTASRPPGCVAKSARTRQRQYA